NLVLYWGQGNKREQRLSYYCQQPGVSIITVGFVHDFTGGNQGTPAINLADHCDDIENCPQVSQDIAFCQQQGVKVLMSLGGASGPYRHQTWEPDTLAWALWNKFLGGTDKTITRPFGDVIMDGIDFDPEGVNGEGWDKLVHNLRVLSKLYIPARNFLITAAPQCPDLDYYKNNALYNILHPNPQYTEAYLDMVFVQFYNNYCSASEFEKSPRNGSTRSFNFEAWNTWAEQTTRATKIYLGILGKKGHHDSGYVQFEQLTKIMDNIHRYSRFGGVMIWDALYAYSNPVF
ncbi:glycoside hydrolase superfamily, partial [Chlamydoabsidia padenii]